VPHVKRKIKKLFISLDVIRNIFCILIVNLKVLQRP